MPICGSSFSTKLERTHPEGGNLPSFLRLSLPASAQFQFAGSAAQLSWLLSDAIPGSQLECRGLVGAHRWMAQIVPSPQLDQPDPRIVEGLPRIVGDPTVKPLTVLDPKIAPPLILVMATIAMGQSLALQFSSGR